MKEIKIINLKTGEVLVNEGEHSSDFYFLNKGSLAIFVGTRRVATIEKEKTMIGEMSFFNGERRSATIIALSDVEVEIISKDSIIEKITENPDFAITIAESLTKKLSEASKKLAETNKCHDYLEKLKRYMKKNPNTEKIINEFDQIQKDRTKSMKDFLNEKSITSTKIIEPVNYGVKYAINNLVGVVPEKKEITIINEDKFKMNTCVIVNISGECEGWYAIGFPKETAIKMASKVIGKEFTEFNEDIINFLKELANIMSGQMITRMKEFMLNISPPTALFGENVLSKMRGKYPSIAISYESEMGDFYTLLNIEIIK
jgi:CheY-specific phosphatase CheX